MCVCILLSSSFNYPGVVSYIVSNELPELVRTRVELGSMWVRSQSTIYGCAFHFFFCIIYTCTMYIHAYMTVHHVYVKQLSL